MKINIYNKPTAFEFPKPLSVILVVQMPEYPKIFHSYQLNDCTQTPLNKKKVLIFKNQFKIRCTSI